MRHANGDAHSHSDGNSNGHIHPDGNSNGNGHIHPDSNSNGNGDCDRTAAAYTDATASADTAATSLIG